VDIIVPKKRRYLLDVNEEERQLKKIKYAVATH